MDAGTGNRDTSLPLLGAAASARLSATDRDSAPPIPKETATSSLYHPTQTATVNRLGERLFSVAVRMESLCVNVLGKRLPYKAPVKAER